MEGLEKHLTERKKRYKNSRLQELFEKSVTLSYPVSFVKDKIGGTSAFYWNIGYEGKRIPKRASRFSSAWIMYYAGKERRKIDNHGHKYIAN